MVRDWLFQVTGFTCDTLNELSDSAYVVDKDLNLVFTNRAWKRFAAQNNGEPAISSEWDKGRNILDSISEPRLKQFYKEFFLNSFSNEVSFENPMRHEYECSSPERFRKFVMTLYPFKNREGVVVVHSLAKDIPMNETDVVHGTKDEIAELQDQGIIRQCSHCRKIQSVRDPNSWLWIPQWVKQSSENVSHTLCELCLDYYYPEPL
jgi:hypothetical protein